MTVTKITASILFVITVITGCGSTPKQDAESTTPASIPTGVQEQLVYSSELQRPVWTLSEPDTADGVMSFVGLSGNSATEQLSREDARRNALNSIVNYMDTLVKDKFEWARVSFGLDSNVVDPTATIRSFEKQLAVNAASKVKM
jgi:hypothetical protein